MFSLVSRIFSSILIFQLLSRYKAKRFCVRNVITIPCSRQFVKLGCVHVGAPAFRLLIDVEANNKHNSELRTCQNAEKLFVRLPWLRRLLSGSFLSSKFLRTEIKHDGKTFPFQWPKNTQVDETNTVLDKSRTKIGTREPRRVCRQQYLKAPHFSSERLLFGVS